ncbi:hypothetical protein PVAG01_08923 [Phlyctema vagabunda]|uniref:Uncharacterized protein n=1 Tax=Phlyctema vagabunda TaxID=108571 RepID=A0ABR4PAU0_9HELO
MSLIFLVWFISTGFGSGRVGVEDVRHLSRRQQNQLNELLRSGLMSRA